MDKRSLIKWLTNERDEMDSQKRKENKKILNDLKKEIVGTEYSDEMYGIFRAQDILVHEREMLRLKCDKKNYSPNDYAYYCGNYNSMMSASEDTIIDFIAEFVRLDTHNGKYIEARKKGENELAKIRVEYNNLINNIRLMTGREGTKYLIDLGFKVEGEQKKETAVVAKVDIDFLKGIRGDK